MYICIDIFILFILSLLSMGILKQGILGGFSGKVANVVGSSWKGIAVIKAKPLSVANPKTAGQVAQRGKFSNVVAFAQAILSVVIKPLWDRFASKQSGFNAFISANIDLFEDAVPSTAADLVISSGKMASTAIDSAVFVGLTGALTVSWSDDSGSGFKLGTDVPFLVVVDEEKELVLGFDGSDVPKDRSDESIVLDLLESGVESGDTINVYLAFRRADGTVVSTTAFAEATE
jgi:hypothetical protein